MVTVTAAAANEIRKIFSEQNLDTSTYLRVGVKGGGCSGFEYTLDLIDSKNESDEEFAAEGINIIVDPKSHIYLDGTTIDFKNEIMGRGFVFKPPEGSNTHQCGCGQSFNPG